MTHSPGASASSPLRPGQLRDPLLKALGKATNYQANVFVSHTGILDATIREAGHDPDNLPDGWSRKRRSNGGGGAGLDRNISLAFRYAYRDKNPALTVKGPKAGQWGLTDHGIAYVKQMLPRPLPKPRIFHEPIVKVLGHFSDHTAGRPVKHDVVIREVMVEIGVDPDNLPLGWEERGSNRQIKALDRVRWAVKAMRTAKTPLVQQVGRGLWALTEAGEASARDLNGVPAPVVLKPSSKPPSGSEGAPRPEGLNVTSEWLAEHLTPAPGQKDSELTRMMRAALCKRLPVSANTQQIDDHIQNFCLRMIRRDAFRKHLEDGGRLPLSKVVAYCVNSGRTDARDMGSEPVCRAFYGARTEKERRERPEKEPQFGDTPGATLDSDGGFVTDDCTTIDDTALDFDQMWERVEEAVEYAKPQAWERYTGILAMRAQGFSTQQIADAEGVSRNRAASMLADARRCVRASINDGDFADLL